MCNDKDCCAKSKLYELWKKHKKEEEEAEKKNNMLVMIFAIIGAIVAVAGISYAIYRYLTPDYLDEFEDEFEDDEFEDDFFDESEEVVEAIEAE